MSRRSAMALGWLAVGAAVARAEPPSPPEDAARAVLAALERGDVEALRASALRDEPDP